MELNGYNYFKLKNEFPGASVLGREKYVSRILKKNCKIIEIVNISIVLNLKTKCFAKHKTK
jgi:hypothetical protein